MIGRAAERQARKPMASRINNLRIKNMACIERCTPWRVQQIVLKLAKFFCLCGVCVLILTENVIMSFNAFAVK